MDEEVDKVLKLLVETPALLVISDPKEKTDTGVDVSIEDVKRVTAGVDVANVVVLVGTPPGG